MAAAAYKTTWRPRVVIVDDSRTVQAMLEQIFLNRLECEIVGIAHDVEEALPMIQEMRPDIVTIDLRMPGRSGMDLLRDLRDERFTRKVVIASEIANNEAMLSHVSDLGADAAFDKRVFTGRPGFFCVKMRELITAIKKGKAREDMAVETDMVETPESRFQTYPAHAQETERVRFISEAGLGNALPDPVFDGLTRYLGETSGFPICLLTMVDSHVQWVKSAHGLEVEWTARADAFCTYTICQDMIFAVPNALTDARFAYNPLVMGMPGMRSYFGCPVTSPAGIRLGALCLIDLRPRKLSPAIENNLRSMAGIVSSLIDERWNAHADQLVDIASGRAVHPH